MSTVSESPQRANLREQVESMLPGWQSWYPSLFDAAADLGLIRARVCAPSSLLLSNRHAAVQQEALQAFKEVAVEDEPGHRACPSACSARNRQNRRSGGGRSQAEVDPSSVPLRNSKRIA
jgi:hypothetical protein